MASSEHLGDQLAAVIAQINRPGDFLDDAPLDEDRVSEATGNEGATFERSYHRAVVVLWPRARRIALIAQGGWSGAAPHLAKLLRGSKRTAEAAAQARTLLVHLIDGWGRVGDACAPMLEMVECAGGSLVTGTAALLTDALTLVRPSVPLKALELSASARSEEKTAEARRARRAMASSGASASQTRPRCTLSRRRERSPPSRPRGRPSRTGAAR